MSTREKDEQRALDIVAGRAGNDAAPAAQKSGLGTLEFVGIGLWLLVLVGGGFAAAYFFLLAPK